MKVFLISTVLTTNISNSSQSTHLYFPNISVIFAMPIIAKKFVNLIALAPLRAVYFELYEKF